MLLLCPFQTVRLFDVETNQEIRSFRGHNSSVATIAFKPNSNVVFTGSKDSTIKCWDMTSGRCTKTFSSHLGEVRTAAARGGLRASALYCGSALVMCVLEGGCLTRLSCCLLPLLFVLMQVTSVDVNSAGTSMLSSSKDNSNRLWDLRLGKPLHRFKGHQNTSKNFIRSAFGPNERYACCTDEVIAELEVLLPCHDESLFFLLVACWCARRVLAMYSPY